ncbi:MAG: hypothetical protein PHF37_00550 [Phycisphaerae bacterium]|nr:hypothetical protein [Phycisphaerae bacterium]
MGIKIEHRPSGESVGNIAYAVGQGEGLERRTQQDREYSLQREINAIRERARQDANAQFYAQLQAQIQARNDEMAFRERQYEELPGRQQQLGEIENSLRKDLGEWEYSRAQQRELAKLSQARDYVTRNPDGRYSPQEQENFLRQIDEMEFGFKPMQKKTESPWPKEQDVGQIWTDQTSGATLTRDDKGNVKVLVDPDDSTSFANQLKLKETIAKHAKDIYDSRQMSENPISIEESFKIAEKFYADLMPQPQNNPTPAGDEETMADTMLRSVMSPQTYQAAKATGLPLKDIYFMTQQLMSQPQGSVTLADDVKKKDWLANDNNFNKFKERYARGVPRSQIEQDYQNQNAAPDKIALEWQQAGGDPSAEYAYQKYLKEHKKKNLPTKKGWKTVDGEIVSLDWTPPLTRKEFWEKANEDDAFAKKYFAGAINRKPPSFTGGGIPTAKGTMALGIR